MNFFDILLAKKMSGGGGGSTKYAIVGNFIEGAEVKINNIELEIVTPAGVTTLKEYAFNNNYNYYIIKKIILTDITTIEQYAFYNNNDKLFEVIMPKIVTIGKSAFNGANKITQIDLPNTISSIDQDAFRNTSNLKDFYCRATTPPTLGTNVFYSSGVQNIYVPKESVDAYKSAPNWSAYAIVSKIKPIPEE